MIVLQEEVARPLDGRVGIGLTVSFAVGVGMLDSPAALGAAVGVSVVALALSRVPMRRIAGRIVALELLAGLAVLSVPFGVPGDEVARIGGLSVTSQGLWRAADLGLSATAATLMALAVLMPLGPLRLGQALGRLGVPGRLVHLMLLTVRYLDVIAEEVTRSRTALKVRGFRPGSNRHTWRTLGHLVGMALIRALDRAERIGQAMRCRGFAGTLVMLDRPALGWREALALGGGVLAGLGLGGVEMATWRP